MPNQPIIFFDDSNAAMTQARQNARHTFRFFWREVSWEHRRIIPALEFSAVKIAFADPPPLLSKPKPPEEMWIGDVQFDGKSISGKLLNQPHWLSSIAQGDAVSVPTERMSDWMYAIQGKAYGGYTVQLLRMQMQDDERRAHDSSWDLDFGDPNMIEVTPLKWAPPDRHGADPPEHPMALNMGPSLEEQLKKTPELVRAVDERGFTLLHQLALAGSNIGVTIAIKHGAEINQKGKNGMTPLALAKSLNWRKVVDTLLSNGGLD